MIRSPDGADMSAERVPLPPTPFYRQMRRGHVMRTGHELDAEEVRGNDGIYRIVRYCCGT